MRKNKGAEDRYIEIIPVGYVDQNALSHVTEVVEQRFKVEVRLGHPIDMPEAAFNASRKQYNAGIILNEVNKNRSPNSAKVLGVIEDDIYTGGLNYVFGQAMLGGCCGVISLSRLRWGIEGTGKNKLFLSRVEKEAVHELGHTFGLKHCPNPRCVMFFSSNLDDTDRKSADFCPECGIPEIRNQKSETR